MNRKRSQSFNPSHGIASCAIVVTLASEIQLLPAGEFRAIDGHPKDAPHWFIDATLAISIIAEFENRVNRMVVDYEHQTLLSAQNGQPTPDAGWFGKLAWRPSTGSGREGGLYAIDVEWTERATQMIEGGEYKYISLFFCLRQEDREGQAAAACRIDQQLGTRWHECRCRVPICIS